VSSYVIHQVRWREQTDPACGVAAKLRPSQQSVKVGEVPELSLILINKGSEDVVLVRPGDGSECGWRTPLIEWSESEWFSGPRCGNINALRPEEVFTLKPGESKQFSEWVGIPAFERPGRYRLSVRYTNIPELAWHGISMGSHDRPTLQAVRQSTKVVAVSNSVEFLVEP
jgi:hypothetical protein